MVDLKTVKLYLRIDGDEEDELLNSFIEFSREEIENSTGVKYTSCTNRSTYKIAQLVIISDRYENRGSQDLEYKPNNSLSSLYTKLKYGEDNAEEDIGQ